MKPKLEMRIWVQVVYSVGDPRNKMQGKRLREGEREQLIRYVLFSWLP